MLFRSPPLPYEGRNSGSNDTRPIFRDRDPSVLQRDCVSACAASKQAGVDAASRYYQTDLPRRLNAEKQTLARLTGWRMDEIDALPGALRFSAVVSPGETSPGFPALPTSPGRTEKPWWEQLFNTGSAKPTGSGSAAGQAHFKTAS